MALQHEIIVVHLPPYHCALNPIELIWSWVKHHVAEKKTTFKIADVQETVAAVLSDLRKSTCRHCENLVENIWVADNVQDEVAELTIEIDGQEDDDGGDEEEEEKDGDENNGEEE